MLTPETKECLACGKTVKGRSDKKFCDDYCRNNYNNQLKAETNNYVRRVTNALRKNRRILEMTLGTEGMVKIPKQKLMEQGFLFKYHTHSYKNAKGNTYLFCYEYGYLPLERDWFLIVKKADI